MNGGEVISGKIDVARALDLTISFFQVWEEDLVQEAVNKLGWAKKKMFSMFCGCFHNTLISAWIEQICIIIHARIHPSFQHIWKCSPTKCNAAGGSTWNLEWQWRKLLLIQNCFNDFQKYLWERAEAKLLQVRLCIPKTMFFNFAHVRKNIERHTSWLWHAWPGLQRLRWSSLEGSGWLIFFVGLALFFRSKIYGTRNKISLSHSFMLGNMVSIVRYLQPEIFCRFRMIAGLCFVRTLFVQYVGKVRTMAKRVRTMFVWLTTKVRTILYELFGHCTNFVEHCTNYASSCNSLCKFGHWVVTVRRSTSKLLWGFSISTPTCDVVFE